jgi:hypothetical protein
MALEPFPSGLIHLFVMAGLVPAIHALAAVKTWMPGTSPGMTNADAAEIAQHDPTQAESDLADNN